MFTDTGRTLRELSRRVDYHGGDVARAMQDLNDEDRNRISSVVEVMRISPELKINVNLNEDWSDAVAAVKDLPGTTPPQP